MSREFPECVWESGSLANMANYADLIVNCTSLGMEPDVDGMPWDPDQRIRSNQMVYDLVYNPTPTKLVRFAADGGAPAFNGKGMLVWQGAIAFELWTGVPAPVDVMQRAIGLR